MRARGLLGASSYFSVDVTEEEKHDQHHLIVVIIVFLRVVGDPMGNDVSSVVRGQSEEGGRGISRGEKNWISCSVGYDEENPKARVPSHQRLAGLRD